MAEQTGSLPDKLGRILVAGAGGYMGLFYLKALKSLGIPEKNIIAVDINPEHLSAVKNGYSPLMATENISEALALDPNIAFVLTNTPAHGVVIEECHKAGIRKYFVEKPLVDIIADLEMIEKLDLEMVFTSHLINFSGIVSNLESFMVRNSLFVLQARAVWGKNWCSVKRWMGGDMEEEIPHPMALIIRLASINRKIKRIAPHARFSFIPFVQAGVSGPVKRVFYPDNDSSIIDLKIESEMPDLNAHILSSFNMFEQIRRVELSFAQIGKRVFPRVKACLEFDVNGKDILRIKDSVKEDLLFKSTATNNKLLDQLECALKAFAGEKLDPRLIDFKHSAWFVRIICSALYYGNRRF
jgi:hypothetical protein